jgi:hypothetical protein
LGKDRWGHHLSARSNLSQARHHLSAPALTTPSYYLSGSGRPPANRLFPTARHSLPGAYQTTRPACRVGGTSHEPRCRWPTTARRRQWPRLHHLPTLRAAIHRSSDPCSHHRHAVRNRSIDGAAGCRRYQRQLSPQLCQHWTISVMWRGSLWTWSASGEPRQDRIPGFEWLSQPAACPPASDPKPMTWYTFCRKSQ